MSQPWAVCCPRWSLFCCWPLSTIGIESLCDPGDFGWTAPRSGGFDCFSRSIDFDPGFLEWKPGFLLSAGHRLDRCSSVRFLSFCSAKMEAQSDLCHGGGWYFRARRVLLFVDLIKYSPWVNGRHRGNIFLYSVYLPTKKIGKNLFRCADVPKNGKRCGTDRDSR